MAKIKIHQKKEEEPKIKVVKIMEEELNKEEYEKSKEDFENKVFSSKEMKITSKLLAEIIILFNKMDIQVRYVSFAGFLATLYSEISLPDALKDDAFNIQKLQRTLENGLMKIFLGEKTEEKGEYIG